ncbi:hypothetical protein [Dyella subtropica]|uniref:hypothetical protein n=1 Tax=Dyella subtropica TaxID=2992127 RepID=UPI00225B0645|nr:hypothetical protein [Dyella subtropica]
MSLYPVPVDSNANSVAGSGVASFKAFLGGPLKPGDTITISVEPLAIWNSGGSIAGTNASGFAVNPNNIPPIDYSSFVPCQPNAHEVPTYPNAANYGFGVGVLVGSLDGGSTFFAVGTNFSMVYLGSGDSAAAPAGISLFFWDVNSADNVGSLMASVNVIRANA